MESSPRRRHEPDRGPLSLRVVAPLKLALVALAASGTQLWRVEAPSVWPIVADGGSAYVGVVMHGAVIEVVTAEATLPRAAVRIAPAPAAHLLRGTPLSSPPPMHATYAQLVRTIESLEAMATSRAWAGSAERLQLLELAIASYLQATLRHPHGYSDVSTEVLWKMVSQLKEAVEARDATALFAAATDLKDDLAVHHGAYARGAHDVGAQR